MAARFVGLVIASSIAFGRGDARAQCAVGATAIPSTQMTAIPDCAIAGFTQTLIVEVVDDVLDCFGDGGERWTFPPEGSEEFEELVS